MTADGVDCFLMRCETRAVAEQSGGERGDAENTMIHYKFKIKLKFVYNIRYRSGLNYKGNLTITKILI